MNRQIDGFLKRKRWIARFMDNQLDRWTDRYMTRLIERFFLDVQEP